MLKFKKSTLFLYMENQSVIDAAGLILFLLVGEVAFFYI